MPSNCPVCNEPFQFAIQLQQHLRQHKDYKPLECAYPGCTYRTANTSNLGAHIRTHNPTIMLQCNWSGCQFSTVYPSNLIVHKRIHDPQIMLQCDYPNCTYRTAHSTDLTIHKRGHTPESRLQCGHPGCTYHTTHPGNFTAHKRIHNPESMFTCDYPGCNYRTAHPSNLVGHKRIHNPESQLQCNIPGCTYRTAHTGDLTSHKRKRHPDTLLQCDQPGCSYRTPNAVSLNRHRVRMHLMLQPAFLNNNALSVSSPRHLSPPLSPVTGGGLSPLHDIKQEPQERSASPLLNPLKRTLDDNGPILRNPDNPSESMMHLAERPTDQITVTRWGDLPADSITRRRINDEIRQWLRDEGNHAARFAELLHVMCPIDDGPERGLSVFAKRDLPPCTVLGPYAGILHDDLRSNSLSAERRKFGTNNIHRYTFQTRSEQRLVSAFSSGNVLSLINTAALPGHTPLPGKRNNVSAIVVGKNITFYVTNTFIPEGEELFVDYGPDYEAEPNAKRLKQEAVSRSPSPESRGFSGLHSQ